MEAFKNIYNEKEINRLANEIKFKYKNFRDEEFINSIINDSWERKGLKERIRTIAIFLGKFLPNDYIKALNILIKVQDEFNGLFHLVFPDFVEIHGLEYYDESIKALKVFTNNCSSEFAIRPFLIKYPQLIEEFKLWAKDENEHVRRLASEGCRPRLPWAMNLPLYKKNPEKVLEVLELLKDDNSQYVRKSVANNLNDISKDNPKIVKELFKNWYGYSIHTNWIVKHAARSLLKQKDEDVLNLFGYNYENIYVSNLKVDDKIKLNEYLNFSFLVYSGKSLGKLRLEYKLGFVRQKNKINYKIFRISERDEKLDKIIIKKLHHFKEVSTRKYYEGIHSITIVINGKEFITKEFYLNIK